MRIVFYPLIICLLSCSACCHSLRQKNAHHSASFVPGDSTQLYFPINAFEKDVKGRRPFNGYVSNLLFRMREPVLYKYPSDGESYRFIWLRTFHNPVAIRFERNKTHCKIVWKMLEGSSGYEVGGLIERKSKVVPLKHWLSFKGKLERMHFFGLPTIDPKPNGMDGAIWILEAKTTNGYHVIERWSPYRTDIYDICNDLIELTDLKIKESDKY